MASAQRQCGKSTLAGTSEAGVAPGFFDLENPVDTRRLENPMPARPPLKGLVVISKPQMQPPSDPVLRVLAGRLKNPASFLLVGNASPVLIRGASEPLAGRASLVDTGGSDVEQLGLSHWLALWMCGEYPRPVPGCSCCLTTIVPAF